ncbi:hypothetical protein [Phenylobacterium sp.]|uniref:terminase small subunit-like protein n=1 Tax=Phenylobacterium sp. TaxID=1871053 RepID=UPI00272544A9|nr:hypothetical protein [Phenylobacterium sp.]MDO8378291.1 hypothetical protein [Phenylobacterium sp.]
MPDFDRTGGWKPSAYRPAIGRVILARVEVGETITSIVADPEMPCRATLYRWLAMHEDFAADYADVRRVLAENALWSRDQDDAARRVYAARMRGRPHRGGQKTRYTLCRAWAFCEAVAAGMTLADMAGDPALPTPKMVYRWLRQRPEFRAMYERARAAQRLNLQLDIDQVVDRATPFNLAAAKREVAWLQGRIGRLTPKLYRTRL